MTKVVVDYSRDKLLSDAGLAILKDRYLLPGEESPQDAFARAAEAFSDSPEMAQRIYDYASQLWFMFSTPVLSNAPVRKTWQPPSIDYAYDWNRALRPECYEPARGMPISCFLNYVPDSLKGIGDHWIENMYLASNGGGIGGHYSALRSDGTGTSRGSQSNGIIPFIKVVDSEMMAVSQGKTRRGSYAAYLDISHPEIEEFLALRKPTGGDLNRKALNLHHGVNIPDSFMELIVNCQGNPDCDDSWDLIDPHTKKVVKTVSAKRLWEQLLETRMQTGEPYIAFIDAINRAMPADLLNAGYRAHGSNLCAEITLPTAPGYTAVCCLSSVNIAKYPEWMGNEQFLPDIVRFLDNVLEFFLLNAPDEMRNAKRSVQAERSIGIGAMGWHTFLQQQRIPFESAMAESYNRTIFKHIRKEAERGSRELVLQRGTAGLSHARRNLHLLAIAPNASSSLICGSVSPSIEPMRANIFIQKTMSGTFTVKNRVLEEVLWEKGLEEFHKAHPSDTTYDAMVEWTEQWVEKQWRDILRNKGSVQHLEYLSDDEKDVFKTAMEIDQRWLIHHAATRAPMVCQSQSLNLFLPPDVDLVELHGLHVMAWAKGLKTLYYLRSEAIKRAETISTKVERKNIGHFTEETCLSCEG